MARMEGRGVLVPKECHSGCFLLRWGPGVSKTESPGMEDRSFLPCLQVSGVIFVLQFPGPHLENTAKGRPVEQLLECNFLGIK